MRGAAVAGRRPTDANLQRIKPLTCADTHTCSVSVHAVSADMCRMRDTVEALLALHYPPPLLVPLLTDPCHFWSSSGRHVHQIPGVAAKQHHNEKCLHISSVSQTPIETKSSYRTCVLFTVLIGGKINVLCISTVLLKQDKGHMSKYEAAAIE